MKTLVKSFFMALVAGVATGAMATPAFISFKTVPGITYADGTEVLEGEIVALCWSPNATFGGLSLANGAITAKVEGEKVLSASSSVKKDAAGSSYAENYWIADQEGGKYFVYVLDTRVSATQLGEYATVLNGATETIVTSVAGITGAEGVEKSTDYGAATYVTSAATLTITSTAEGSAVQAVGLSPAASYVILSGDVPGKFTAATEPFSAFTNTDKATIPFDGSKAKFFQLFESGKTPELEPAE